ncbi:MAG: TRL domain-containing protein [Nitrospirales bacterium]|nr:TRL domain-containing protein [Nitrospirales bacterium]
MVTSHDAGTKEATSYASEVWGIIAKGDASIQAVKNNVGITKVTHVDHSAKISWRSMPSGIPFSEAIKL